MFKLQDRELVKFAQAGVVSIDSRIAWIVLQTKRGDVGGLHVLILKSRPFKLPVQALELEETYGYYCITDTITNTLNMFKRITNLFKLKSDGVDELVEFTDTSAKNFERDFLGIVEH